MERSLAVTVCCQQQAKDISRFHIPAKKKKKKIFFSPLSALEPTHLFPVDYAQDPSPASSCYRWTNEMLAMETFGSPA